MIRKWWNSIGPEGHKSFYLTLFNITVVCILLLLAAGSLYRLDKWIFAGNGGAVAEKAEARIFLANAPDWMSENLANAVCFDLTAGELIERYDDDLAARVAARASQCPWIEALGSVEIEFPDLSATSDKNYCIIKVLARYRYPLAIIEDQRNWAYVDRFGFVLPADQADQLCSSRHNVRIIGSVGSLPDVGRAIDGDDITAALALVENFIQKPYYGEIAVIDISNYKFRNNFSDPQIVVSAVAGQYVTQIRFGAFPLGSLPPAGEPTVDQKFSNLDKWYVKNGQFISGPSFLDLRYPDNVVAPTNYVR